MVFQILMHFSHHSPTFVTKYSIPAEAPQATFLSFSEVSALHLGLAAAMAAEGSAPLSVAGSGHLYECLGKSSHVDPQLAGDISSLNSLSDAQIKQVISFVVAFLQSPKVSGLASHFRSCTAPRLGHTGKRHCGAGRWLCERAWDCCQGHQGECCHSRPRA